MSAKLREYISLASRLRQLKRIGRFESETAEHVRGLMEDIWRGLTPDEANQASSAAADVLTDSLETDTSYLTE